MKTASRVTLAACAAVLLAGCGPETPPLIITKSELGEAWPLTVAEVKIFCPQPGVPLLDLSDGYLAITGAGAAIGARQMTTDHPLWKDSGAGAKTPLGPLIARATALCGGGK